MKRTPFKSISILIYSDTKHDIYAQIKCLMPKFIKMGNEGNAYKRMMEDRKGRESY
jgi:hypothetical protein